LPSSVNSPRHHRTIQSQQRRTQRAHHDHDQAEHRKRQQFRHRARRAKHQRGAEGDEVSGDMGGKQALKRKESGGVDETGVKAQ
jgi:hypothetical protein